VCDWVKANYRGRNATVKKDEWGFTMANFRARVPFGYQSFAFPIHCQQVYFSDDEEELGWKVVMRTEVRGRRVDNETGDEEEPQMFAMGQDAEYEGLQVGTEVPHILPHEPEGGINFELNELFNEVEENEKVLQVNVYSTEICDHDANARSYRIKRSRSGNVVHISYGMNECFL
jgi:hypothetical protein